MDTAETMLNEIHSETVLHLITSIRNEISSPGSTHIPALDAHLTSASRRSLNYGDVIEIQGSPCSGKTHFIYHFLSICIMPSTHDNITLGGWNKGAYLFDVDGTFDTCRFHRILHCRLTALLGSASTADSISNLAKTCLTRLHIFYPQSSNQLAVTIINLPAHHGIHMSNIGVGVVAVDSISAFYWLDRFTAEQLRSGLTGAELNHPLHRVLSALQNFRLSHGPVILLTNWGLVQEAHPGLNTLYKQHLSPFLSSSNHFDPTINHNSQSMKSTLSPVHHITLLSQMDYHKNQVILPNMAYISGDSEMLEKRGNKWSVGIARTKGFAHSSQFNFHITSDNVIFPS